MFRELPGDLLCEVFEPGDIIVDGGNALFTDTIRREKEVSAKGINFVGAGISGGEEGALKGPSIMPGGSAEAYKTLGPILASIAAIAEGEPCVTHVGTDGAGHFVKMIHNGIEYGDMQLICEAYALLAATGMDRNIASKSDGSLTHAAMEDTAGVSPTGRPPAVRGGSFSGMEDKDVSHTVCCANFLAFCLNSSARVGGAGAGKAPISLTLRPPGAAPLTEGRGDPKSTREKGDAGQNWL